MSRAIRRPSPWRLNGSQASRKSTLASACWRRTGTSMASAVRRTNCTSETWMQVCAEAAAEFQKIVDHKGVNWAVRDHYPGQFYSLSYLGLARGSTLAGDPAKAKKAFQDFFQLWKGADSDIPILRQAKAEYARLQ